MKDGPRGRPGHLEAGRDPDRHRRSRAAPVPGRRRGARPIAASRAPASPGRTSRTPPCASTWACAEDEAACGSPACLPHGSGAGVLEPGDVLLEVGGRDPRSHRPVRAPGSTAGCLFPVLLHRRRAARAIRCACASCGTASAGRWTVRLKRMPPEQDDEVPPYVLGRGPDYAVSGGPRLPGALGALPRHLGRLRTDGRPPGCSWPTTARGRSRPRGPALVLLSSVLPDPGNLGYQDLRDLIVTTVNGRRVGTLDDLRRAFAAARRAASTWWSSSPARAPSASCSTRVLPRRPASGSARSTAWARAPTRTDGSFGNPRSAPGRAGGTHRDRGRARAGPHLREPHRPAVAGRLPQRFVPGPAQGPRALRAPAGDASAGRAGALGRPDRPLPRRGRAAPAGHRGPPRPGGGAALRPG